MCFQVDKDKDKRKHLLDKQESKVTKIYLAGYTYVYWFVT